ncbi:preprotein translocase subunit SecG [Mesoaciditoga lauensis]|uniref:preprotein translocase subunit SecG n=1 Tax=Mesoaciditoga lauensis TaxID=1495039 RepID=UPI000565C9DA|nr:preprotein translocase subunit SecG [Mesoaciditoga lauensis]
MGIVFLIVIGIYIAVSVGLIWSVMMQMSKHAGLGGAFGSGSLYTVFGREKGLDTLGKVTLTLAITFMVMSVIVAYLINLPR